MTEGTCIECGKHGFVHKHHVFGKRIDPKTVVDLCPECHVKHHNFPLIIFRNKAVSLWNDWRDEQERIRYVGRKEQWKKLLSLGYVPAHDGWERDEETFTYITERYPVEASIYLSKLNKQGEK